MAAKNLLAMLILIATSFAPFGFGEAAGPWKAQVVDAETGKPLEGVVVLAYWIKYARTVAGKADAQFYDAEEVVTGPDGNFVIQERSTWTLNPFRTISGAQFVMFKPGYGRWRFRNADLWLKHNLPERHEVLLKAYGSRGEKDLMLRFQDEMLKVFRDGSENMSEAVIDLPPLKTREERLEVLRTISWAPVVPSDRTQLIRKAKDAERAYLGLRD